MSFKEALVFTAANSQSFNIPALVRCLAVMSQKLPCVRCMCVCVCMCEGAAERMRHKTLFLRGGGVDEIILTAFHDVVGAFGGFCMETRGLQQ